MKSTYTIRRPTAVRLTIFLLLLLSSLTATTQPWAAVGDVNFISDELKVPLRSGPSTAHRIIHGGLPSGTLLTVLAIDEEAGFTQVRTKGGMEGWVTSQYLVSTPIARDKLATAERRLANLKAKLDKERTAHASIQSEHKEAEANNKTLNSRAEALAQELEELKRISTDAINKHARNVELTKQNERLVHEVNELSATVRRLESNVERDWLLYGGALVLIGLILGVVLKARPRQSSYSRYS